MDSHFAKQVLLNRGGVALSQLVKGRSENLRKLIILVARGFPRAPCDVPLFGLFTKLRQAKKLTINLT